MKRHKRKKRKSREARWDALFDKRYTTDPAYLVGQQYGCAPVKYAVCSTCREHHAPIWLPVRPPRR